MGHFKKAGLACSLFVLMLGLMTLQKMSLVTSLRIVLHPDITMEQGYCVITLLLVSPYLFSLFLMGWNISFLRKSSDCPRPSARNIILGLFTAVVEALCIVIFTTRVMALLPVHVVLPATQGTLAISCAITSFNRNRKSSAEVTVSDGSTCTKWSDRSFLCSGVRITASLLCILASPAVALFLYLMDKADTVTSLTLAIVPSLLGLIWTPELQSHVLDPSGRNPLCHKRFRVLYGAVKVLAIVIFISLEMYIRSDISQTDRLINRFLQGFYVFKETYALVPIFVHFVASLLSFAFSYVSLALCQPLFGVIIPSLVSMVTSIFLCVMLAPSIYGIEETTYFGSFSLYLICSSVLAWAWAWPYILNSSSVLQKPQYLMTPFKVLFRGYGWNPIFSDQKLLLGYNFKHSRDMPSLDKKVKTRIYICTTMYREADYEMERLLMSLIQVCSDPVLEGVHLESNVFMDNGCSGETLNEFALQFVALLVSKANVTLDKARCWLTPYGIQIFCKLPCGLPLFVHLKDPLKVKAKKRWSQSMYINYVMRFRKVLWQNDSESITTFETDISKIIPNLPKNVDNAENNPMNFLGRSEQFMLRRISNIGYPTLVDFRVGADSDHGGTSVEDSSPPNSDSGSQGFAYSSSKESSDLESLPEDRAQDAPVAAYINLGFQSDDYAESSQSSTPSNAHMPDGSSDVTKTNTYTSLDSYNDVAVDDSAMVDDDHTFILATDADMDFKADAIKELLDLCEGDKMIGAACGRTHPVGKRCSPIVWHQVFEYAKDFWMIKNAQNVIGSVSCCPGCFSLYRASAIRDVMDKYSSPTRSPFTVYVKDTGEDRWMATLMMINGWRMRYSPFADNSTYCPDSFEEYYKQRRRWILSDMANAILVVQNLFRLVRNNDCFSLVYIIYLVNMFLNNVITPGTAIVMITAGLELVFDIPYVYTTIPLAVIVYTYAFLCTCTSARTQGLLTSILTVIMGSTFSSVAIYGSYKITSGMVAEISNSHFRFQQHYVILLLTLSLVYAALMHPKESHQIVYGFAYLFIFPAMHVLLPIYSIANIIDQSWGTRDSTNAKLPKISCIPAFRKMRKRVKRSKPRVCGKNSQVNQEDDTKTELQDIISSLLVNMSKGDNQVREEYKFWESLTSTRLGTDVNKGLGKSELADGLRVLRNRLLAGFLILNAVWLGFLSYFYLGLDTPLSRLNIYGIISGALYGFTLIIQIVGLTVSRVEQVLVRVAKYVYRGDITLWVHEKEMSN